MEIMAYGDHIKSVYDTAKANGTIPMDMTFDDFVESVGDRFEALKLPRYTAGSTFPPMKGTTGTHPSNEIPPKLRRRG